MSTNIQKYELEQNGRKYILTTEVEGELVKLTCIEIGISNPPIFIGQYSLKQLCQLSTIFSSTTTIYQAQELLDQTIENQKVSIEHHGDIINIILYLTRETESEDSIIVSKNINTQQPLIKKIPEYQNNQLNLNLQNGQIQNQIVQTTTTETITSSNYSQAQEIPQPQVIIPNAETTTKQEVYYTSNGGYENYKNYETHNYENQNYQNYETQNYESQNYQNYDNINLNTNTTEFNGTEVISNTYNTTVTPTIETVTPIVESVTPIVETVTPIVETVTSTVETTNPTVETVTLHLTPNTVQEDFSYQTETQNQDYNQYYNQYQTETQYQQNQEFTNETTYTEPIQEPQIYQENQQYINQTTYTEPIIQEPQTYIPIMSPKREQIQYTITNTESKPEITYTSIPSNKNPETLQHHQIIEKTTTTTTQQYNNPTQIQQVPSVDMTIYNEKITYLQNEINKIRGEYDMLKNEASKLNGEVGALRSQIQILIDENKILREKKGSQPNETQIHEITILKQENERLRRTIEEYMIEKNTFEQYKRLKEDENTLLKLQVEGLLKNQKNLEEILLLRQKQIEELKYQIQQLIKNANISESKKYIMRQQQKGTSKMNNQTLTIQDTRMEIVKGDIIKSTAELEFLTRKICQNYKKITLNLLYKATIDTDKATVFHNKCDWASRTLVLVKSGNGKRFGGYTTVSWKGDSIEKKDENAFVFSLDKMKIYDIIPEENAIGCYPKYGPVFLGCQIRIFDEFFTKGGTTFEKGLNYKTEEDFELSGGLKKFEVKDIEVYGVGLE